MNREDFTEGSIFQIIFDFWDSGGGDKQIRQFEKRLMGKHKEELVLFIMDAQSRGRFGGGFIHE